MSGGGKQLNQKLSRSKSRKLKRNIADDYNRNLELGSDNENNNEMDGKPKQRIRQFEIERNPSPFKKKRTKKMKKGVTLNL